MRRKCFMLFYLHCFILHCNGGNADKHLSNEQSKTPCMNEDCCEELRLENIQRKSEIDLLTVKLDELTVRLDDEINGMNVKLDAEATRREQDDDALRQEILKAVPLGTILPWVNKANKEADHVEELPKGFALCDGSTILEGVWEGLSLPNLTDGRFLRGGTLLNMLELEEDMIKDHTHEDPGHSHDDNGHKHLDKGHSHDYTDHYVKSGDKAYDNDHDQSRWTDAVSDESCDSSKADIDTGHADITTATTGIGGVSNSDGGDENRPKNMKTAFIMKIIA